MTGFISFQNCVEKHPEQEDLAHGLFNQEYVNNAFYVP
jgi:hypothetical protein